MRAKGKLVAVLTYNSGLWGARMSLMGAAQWARRNADWRFAIQEHRIDEQSLAAQMRGADGIIVSAPILAKSPRSFPRLHTQAAQAALWALSRHIFPITSSRTS